MESIKQEGRSAKLIKDIGIYAIGNIGSKMVTFLMVPLYSYFVSTENFGYYDICLTIIFFLIPFFTFQLRDGAFRFLMDSDTDERKDAIVTFTYRVLFSSTAIAVVVGLLGSMFVRIDYLWYVIGLLVVMCFYEVITQVTRGLGRTVVFVTAGILTSLGIGVFSLLFVAYMHMGIEGIFLANILARLISLVYIEIKVGIIRKYYVRKPRYGDIRRDIIKYSLPLMPGVVCWWLTGSSDRFFIEHYLGLGTNGIYAVALRFTSVLQTLATIFYQAWQETAIKQYESKDRDGFFSNLFNIYIYAFSFLLIIFCFMLKINYGWLVDSEYASSVMFIYPLSLSAMLFALSAFLDMGYQCSRDTIRTLPAIMLAAVVNVVMNYLLVQPFGVWGIIFTSIVSYGVLLTYRVHDMKRYFRLDFYKSSFMPIILVIAGILPYYYLSSVWSNISLMVAVTVIFVVIMPHNIKAAIKIQLKKLRKV